MLLRLVALHSIWHFAISMGTTNSLKACSYKESLGNAIGEEGDATQMVQVRSSLLGGDFSPLQSHSENVTVWLHQQLPHLNFSTYHQPPGSGGMGSIRQELINAMLVSRALNRTLVLDDDWKVNVPLRSAYDVPTMRSRQLRDLGTTFLWRSEVTNAGVDIAISNCSKLSIPHRTTLTQGLDDLVELTITDSANVGIAPHVCVELPRFDGFSGWTEDLSQCEEKVDCVALFRSFQLHPSVEEQLKSIKANLSLAGRGQKHTCFHVNSCMCDNLNDTYIKGAAWTTCMRTLMETMLYNTTLVASAPSILVVGQRDVDTVPMLEDLLGGHGIQRSLFTLADLGVPAVSKKGVYHWYDPAYAQRGAVAWRLCSPRYAQAYIGEQYSGFTFGLLADGLINPQSRGNWSMMLGSGTLFAMNYLDQLAELRKAVPYWIIAPPFRSGGRWW